MNENSKFRLIEKEYEICFSLHRYFTTFAWQIGAVLLVAALALLGLAATTTMNDDNLIYHDNYIRILLNLGSTALILAWYIIYKRFADFAEIVSERSKEIEYEYPFLDVYSALGRAAVSKEYIRSNLSLRREPAVIKHIKATGKYDKKVINGYLRKIEKNAIVGKREEIVPISAHTVKGYLATALIIINIVMMIINFILIF